jgi:hypothetical protein
MEDVAEKWREIEESLELVVLRALEDEGLAKDTSFCMRNGQWELYSRRQQRR